MSLTDALDRYFAAWNDHDPGAVVRSMADGGSYQDPTTGGPLTGDALAANVATLLTGFPDVHFDLLSVAPTSDTTAAAQWLMRGTNTGPMPAGPATGQTVALPGADFIDYDPAADRVAKVTGYFDTATMLTQLGLQAHITPADMEPVTRYGVGLHVDTQRRAIPGAFSVTWIDIDPEHQFTLYDATTSVVMEQLGNNGYLGSCFATIGRRNYTFTAWESVQAAKAALHTGAHAAAMRLAKSGGTGDNAFGITSIWKPEVLNGVFRSGKAETDDLAELTGQWL
ncbi:MAG TPA: nuclear transport factor 2 family protein [Streptosporangiaceae bacterium]|nr:nuclear transport factor 2 family protein [Streptosporangiaceae bacterium]